MSVTGLLDMFVVYERPRDYPTGYVVRRHTVHRDGTNEPDSEAVYASSLDEALRAVPPGRVLLGRHPNDDPAIREVWP